MTEPPRILIIGATRGTGYLIARRLIEDGLRLRAMVRAPERAAVLADSGAEVVRGDVTNPATLGPAVAGMDHVIYTAAVTSRVARETAVRATVHDGVLHTIAAASESGFAGRFMLMGALGTTRASMLGRLLNLAKGGTLQWRRRAEAALRASGLDYTIVHAGILVDRPAGERPIELGQAHLPMHWRYRISRADVAETFARALLHPAARNTTFDAVWARGGRADELDEQLARLRPDAPLPPA